MDYTVIKYNKHRINYGIGFKQLKSGDDYTQMLYCAYYYAVSDHNYSYSIVREGVRIGLILIDNLNPRHLAIMDNKDNKNKTLIESFLQEARILKKLGHL